MRWGAAPAIAVAAAIGAVPGVAVAATITVSTTSDTVANDGRCSLREAVLAVETRLASGSAAGECPPGSGSDTISLPAGPAYKLSSPLSLSGILSLSGAGASTTVIDAAGTGRVLTVAPASVIRVSDVTTTGGHAPDGSAVGNDTPGAAGQPGGGISNAGSLTLSMVTVTSNRAGDGGQAGPAVSGPGEPGGTGGGGGGIYSTGRLTLDHSSVVGNHAGSAGNASGAGVMGPSGGTGGSGGGVLSTAAATLNVLDSTLTANGAGNGGTGSSGFIGGSGGSGGSGGAIRSAGALTISASTISANSAGAGGTGSFQAGMGGAGGQGGGVYDEAPTSQTIVDDTFVGNAAGAGGAGADGGGGANGGFGHDGASGGAIVSAGAALHIVQSTIASNTAGAGGAGGAAPGHTPGDPGSAGVGGAIFAVGSAMLQNSIVDTNGAGSCLGVVTDAGHNLTFPDAMCPGANTDPKLGPLADNGGPTATLALGPGSAALDQVPATGAGCPPTDQRGVGRPQGAGCDIGAFEAGVAPADVAVPAITGHAVVDGALSCSTGTWLNFPLSFAYAWLRDGTAVAGAAGSAYVVSAADGRHRLVCRVTATNQTGSANARSAAVAIPPAPPASSVPRLSGLTLSPRTFAAALRGASIAAAKRRKAVPTGTAISYSDSVAAATTFTVFLPAPGVLHGHACVKRPRHGSKHAKRCTRLIARGSFAHHDAAGADRFHFTGRVRGTRLVPGSYRLVGVARFGRRVSRSVTASFRVKRSSH